MSALRMWMAGCRGGVSRVSQDAMASSNPKRWSCGAALRLGSSSMWKGVTGSLGPCGGGGIPGMAVGSQWCSWAARVYRAAVMMW